MTPTIDDFITAAEDTLKRRAEAAGHDYDGCLWLGPEKARNPDRPITSRIWDVFLGCRDLDPVVMADALGVDPPDWWLTHEYRRHFRS